MGFLYTGVGVALHFSYFQALYVVFSDTDKKKKSLKFGFRGKRIGYRNGCETLKGIEF